MIIITVVDAINLFTGWNRNKKPLFWKCPLPGRKKLFQTGHWAFSDATETFGQGRTALRNAALAPSGVGGSGLLWAIPMKAGTMRADLRKAGTMKTDLMKTGPKGACPLCHCCATPSRAASATAMAGRAKLNAPKLTVARPNVVQATAARTNETRADLTGGVGWESPPGLRVTQRVPKSAGQAETGQGKIRPSEFSLIRPASQNLDPLGGHLR